MRYRLIFLLSLGLLSAFVQALTLECKQDGNIQLGAFDIGVLSKEASGRLQTMGRDTIPLEKAFVTEGDIQRFTSPFRTSQGEYQLEEVLTRTSESSWHLAITLSSATPINANELSLFMTLPAEQFAGQTLMIDGKLVDFPKSFEQREIVAYSTFRELRVKIADKYVTLSNGGEIEIKDERCDGWGVFTFFSRFTPSHGPITHATKSIDIAISDTTAQFVDLRAVCNMGFKDDIANDGVGGWTDQGGNNDMRYLPTGVQTLCGEKFEIIDPASNDGKSCIVLSNNSSMNFPSRAVCSVAGMRGRYLNILHAAAYVLGSKSVGDVIVRYADGTQETLNVVNGKEVDDWWALSRISNGELAWTGNNNCTNVGLYAFSISLADKELSELEFSTETGATWMIVGASLSDTPINRTPSQPITITAGEQWRQIDYPRDVERGSILDFSKLGLQDAPAGKYGFVTRNEDGQFVFERQPDKPVRFYGTNFCYAGNFPSKEEAEKLADRMVANGYNTVRFHHYDIMFEWPATRPSTELNAEALDKLEYLFYCLKSRGIYVMLDLFCSRNPADDEFPSFKNRKFVPYTGKSGGETKAILLLTDDGFENWKAFARNFLTHVNPYTGMSWAQDPAISHISLINEDAIFEVINYDAEVRSIIEKRFEAAHPGLTGSAKIQAFNEFLIDYYNKCYDRMANFLKTELGVKAMLTDQNHWQSIHQAQMNVRYDFVDKHMYWAHPHPASDGTFTYDASCSIKQFGGMALNGNSAARIFGRPYGASEMDYAFPSSHRFEGSPLVGAYAALQDWGAIWQFCFLANDKAITQDHETDIFEIASDPIIFLSEKLAVLFFLRGDVATSMLKLPIHVPENYTGIHDIYPGGYLNAGVFAQIGAQVGNPQGCIADVTTFDNDRFNAAVRAHAQIGKGVFEPEKHFICSTTGELEINSQREVFKVDTPRSTLVVLPEGESDATSVLAVKNTMTHALFGLASVDNEPISTSHRLLFLHISNVLNDGMVFGNSDMSKVLKLGSMPHLARNAKAEVTITFPTDSAKPTVYAIDLGGKRIREVPCSFTDGKLSFTPEVFASATPCMVYEIVK